MAWSPPERWKGEKYALQVGKSTTEVAAMIRADIKAAVAAGDLPAATYSVRSEYFSGGSSIDVEIRDLPDAWMDCEGYVPGTRTDYPDGGWAATNCPTHIHGTGHRVLTPEGRRVHEAVKAIHRAYNHDGSDSMVDYFDVNYYGQVSVETEDGRRWRLAETAKKAARRAELKANPKPKVDKRGLEAHVSRHHRRSTSKSSYDTLVLHHNLYHRHPRYDFDRDHTHEVGQWDYRDAPAAKAG